MMNGINDELILAARLLLATLFLIFGCDVVHLEENFEKDTVPSLNTDKAASIASMDRIRRMIATYKAKLFINHDKAQSDALKLLPAFYD